MAERYGVIMAGGSGSRFWPLSRKALPKQFLNLLGEDNMLVSTVKRCRKLVPDKKILITTGEAYGGLMSEYFDWLESSQLILEPCNRDTAPCMAYALKKIMAQNPEATVCFLPSDHLIENEAAFLEDLKRAFGIAEKTKKIVTLGIVPTYAATGYGYLSCGQNHWDYYECNCFLEKPQEAQAIELLQAGSNLWNSGIFISLAKVLWQHLCLHQQEIVALLEDHGQQPKAIAAVYEQMPKISIDYGVMEKLQKGEVLVLPASFGWDDLGSFRALKNYWQKDGQNNYFTQDTRLAALEGANCLVSREGGLVALLGVKNLLIVEYDGVLLVADKNRDQEIKNLVEYLAAQGEDNYL